MVHDLFNNGRLVNENNLLFDDLDYDSLGNFDYSFDYLLNDSWNLYNLFNIFLYQDGLFDNKFNVLDNFNWDVNDSFDFLYLWYLDDLLDDLLNCNHLWNFNYSVDDLFDDSFYLNDLGNDSEDLQDVIDVYDSHNFRYILI